MCPRISGVVGAEGRTFQLVVIGPCEGLVFSLSVVSVSA